MRRLVGIGSRLVLIILLRRPVLLQLVLILLLVRLVLRGIGAGSLIGGGVGTGNLRVQAFGLGVLSRRGVGGGHAVGVNAVLRQGGDTNKKSRQGQAADGQGIEFHRALRK